MLQVQYQCPQRRKRLRAQQCGAVVWRGARLSVFRFPRVLQGCSSAATAAQYNGAVRMLFFVVDVAKSGMIDLLIDALTPNATS